MTDRQVVWEVREGNLVPVLDGKQLVWAPLPGSQEAFISCPIFEALYEGTRGPGKTLSLLMSFAQHCGRGYGPSWRGVLFRQTYPQLSDVIAKTKQWLPQIFPEAKYNEQKATWTWPDGEELLLRHMKDPEDYWSFHGHELPWIGWEELTTWPSDECYTRMFSVCRSSNPNVPKMVRATTNPYGSGHHWVKMRFNLPLRPGAVVGPVIRTDDPATGKPQPERVAIHGSLQENKVLLHADPHYIDRLRLAASNEAQLKAWTEGSWDIVSGGMLDDVWQPIHNRLPRFSIPRSWRIDRAFDWGSSRPFSVGWWAESDGSPLILPNGRQLHTLKRDTFRVGEWYGWNGKPNEGARLTAREIAVGILERDRSAFQDHRIYPGPADSSIFDSSTSTGKSVADEMLAAGVRWKRADKGPMSRINGWARLRTLLKNAHPNPDGTPREHPGLFVTDACPQWIRTVPALPRDDKNLEDVDSDSEDHCLVGSTLVETPEGLFPIASLPSSGIVVSIDGYREYFDCRLTRRDAVLYAALMEDGRAVVATPDHRFMTEDGEWVQLRHLAGRRLACASSAPRSKSLPANVSICAGPTSDARDDSCTESFGEHTMGQSPVATMCTTDYPKPTTRSRISNSCPDESIGGTTCATIAESNRREMPSLNMHSRQQPNGTARRPVESGIVSTIGSTAPRGSPNAPGGCANPAGFPTKVSRSPSSAHRPARPVLGGHRGLTTNFEPVQSATRISSPAGSSPSELALVPAAAASVGVIDVRPAGRGDVYCMHVPVTHAFVIEGGIISRNCGDETRYRVYTTVGRFSKKPVVGR